MGAKPLDQSFEDLWPDARSTTPSATTHGTPPPDAAGQSLPMLTQEDVDNAYRAGVAEGRRRADADREARALDILQQIEDHLANGQARYDETVASTIDALSARAILLCQEFALQQFDTTTKTRLTAAVHAVLAAPSARPALTVTVGDDVLAACEKLLAPLADNCRVTADARLGSGDFSVSWADGGLETRRAAYTAELNRTVTQFFTDLHMRDLSDGEDNE